jgi:oligoendopeptidase F
LFPDDDAWEHAFRRFQRQAKRYARYQGHLGESETVLASCLRFDSNLARLAERLGVYAYLKAAEDQTNSTYQRMLGRFRHTATLANEAASFIRPEILALPDSRLRRYLASRHLSRFHLKIARVARYRPHTLGRKEEELLAMQGEMAQAAGHIFRKLLDADMTFGTVRDERGREIELTNATFSQLLHSSSRRTRKTAFRQYYGQFRAHQNTLAAALFASVQKDGYYARVRKYDGALAAALFPDSVPRSVYTGLIQAVRKSLPVLHRYYDLRQRKLRLRAIHYYDTYVPLLPELSRRRTWKQAADTVVAALAPLGSEYCGVLERGLHGRWCDRYPNRGKQSGAFSCGSYDGDPYILMNYKPDVLDDVFTLAHEAGHSMHSYYSARHQPFEYYDCAIFVAEVASTFNEQLLSHAMMASAADDRERAFLVNREIDSIRATIVRQTMFAEFEMIIHQRVEQGEPLTVASLHDIYLALLQEYFGTGFTIDEELPLECLRIPHFYRPFYVYKYATGLSAAIALSRRVLNGGQQELQDYLRFLQGGCSQEPLDLLRSAGVDLERPEVVATALDRLNHLVDELDRLV